MNQPLAPDRLPLPGPRWLWWALGVAGVLLPGALVVSTVWLGERAPSSHDVAVDVRVQTMLWRITASFGTPLKAAKPAKPAQPGHAALPDDASTTTLPFGATDTTHAWTELFHDAQAADAHAGKTVKSAPRQAEMVVALALATRHDDLARAWTPQLRQPSADIRAALRGLPDPPELALDVTSAVAQVRERQFGHGWSPYLRERVRLRVEAAAGPSRALKARVAQLQERDSQLSSLARTLMQLLFFAGLLGTTWLIVLAIRAVGGSLRGEAPFGWLQRQFPGLGEMAPFHRDPLVPLLGGAAWFAGGLAAAALAALLSGPRASHGLSNLLQSMTGLMVAVAVVQAFARVEPPLQQAARLGEGFWTASTAALRAYCVLLPAMLVVAVLNGLLTGDGGDMHPVVGFLLDDAEPLQLGALAVAVIIAAPLGEELLFRGFLYRVLRQRWGVRAALLSTSLVFAGLHVGPPAMAPYVLLGLAFGLVYEWTGSLWANVVLHSLWNAVVFTFAAMLALS